MTFLLIPALPPSQVSFDPVLLTKSVCDVFVYSCPAPLPESPKMYPTKLYSGPTIQSRPAARRAAQDLVQTNNLNALLLLSVCSITYYRI